MMGKPATKVHLEGWLLHKCVRMCIMAGIIITFIIFSYCADCCLGDWHCAYVLLYGPRVLEVTEDVPMETEQQTSAAEISS